MRGCESLGEIARERKRKTETERKSANTCSHTHTINLPPFCSLVSERRVNGRDTYCVCLTSSISVIFVQQRGVMGTRADRNIFRLQVLKTCEIRTYTQSIITHIQTHRHTDTDTHTHTHTQTQASKHAHARTRTHTCTHTLTQGIDASASAITFKYAYTHKYTYAHTCV